jgi:hypothetical protein
MDADEKLKLGYEEALKQLRQHPALIWTRNNFFLLIQSGLLAFTLNMHIQSKVRAALIATIAGLLSAVAWLWVNVAGRLLQREWRDIVKEFEGQLFTGTDTAQAIKGPFHRVKSEGLKESLSITRVLILLSIVFIVLWIVLLALNLLGVSLSI